MATYAIGDVQGCYNELQALFDIIHYKPESDVLWFTGDLVNRGPKSLKVLRLLYSLPASTVVVLGNHDLHLLALAYGIKAPGNKDSLKKILIAEDREELFQWLRQRPLLHYDAKLNIVMTHAGILPTWDLATAQQLAREVEQTLCGEHFIELLQNMYGNTPEMWQANLTGFDRYRFILNVFTRMRYCDQQGRLNLTKKDVPQPQTDNTWLPWFTVPHRTLPNTPIVFGHWAALLGKTNTPNAWAVDTGCVWGGALTALRLEDQQRFSVPSAQYAKDD